MKTSIRWDSAWQEYVVSCTDYITYHDSYSTDNLEDAVSMAMHMAPGATIKMCRTTARRWKKFQQQHTKA